MEKITLESNLFKTLFSSIALDIYLIDFILMIMRIEIPNSKKGIFTLTGILIIRYIGAVLLSLFYLCVCAFLLLISKNICKMFLFFESPLTKK
mgnify:CR=1 FL=1